MSRITPPKASAPLRYRLALRAYPSAYRRWWEAEILTTLADRDREHGGPSGREAFALAATGIKLRAPSIAAPGLSALAGLLGLASACMPARLWSTQILAMGDSAMPVLTGPPLWARLWVAAASMLLLAVLAARSPWRWPFGVAVVGLPACVAVARYVNAPAGSPHLRLAEAASLAAGVGVVSLLVLLVSARIDHAHRRRALGAALAIAAAGAFCATAARAAPSDLPWGPAMITTLLTIALAATAAAMRSEANLQTPSSGTLAREDNRS